MFRNMTFAEMTTFLVQSATLDLISYPEADKFYRLFSNDPDFGGYSEPLRRIYFEALDLLASTNTSKGWAAIGLATAFDKAFSPEWGIAARAQELLKRGFTPEKWKGIQDAIGYLRSRSDEGPRFEQAFSILQSDVVTTLRALERRSQAECLRDFWQAARREGLITLSSEKAPSPADPSIQIFRMEGVEFWMKRPITDPLFNLAQLAIEVGISKNNPTPHLFELSTDYTGIEDNGYKKAVVWSEAGENTAGRTSILKHLTELGAPTEVLVPEFSGKVVSTGALFEETVRTIKGTIEDRLTALREVARLGEKGGDPTLRDRFEAARRYLHVERAMGTLRSIRP
ncbi:MAG: hypothetical protein V1495_09355 [Pseudomonadota bacterium]